VHIPRSRNTKGVFVKKIRTEILAAVVGVAATVAFPAAGLAQSRTGESHWYVGGQVGRADWDRAGDEDTSIRLLGGYQANKSVAVEFGYIDFGSVSGGSAKGKAWDVVGVGTIPVGDKFGVYGKLGFAWSEVKGFGQNESGIELTYGVGVSYDFSPTVAFRGEWQKYPDAGDGATDIDVLSIGVIFRFK
jgi:OmpA-OmpF porin, OOP family